jgi:hypothetical protein
MQQRIESSAAQCGAQPAQRAPEAALVDDDKLDFLYDR